MQADPRAAADDRGGQVSGSQGSLSNLDALCRRRAETTGRLSDTTAKQKRIYRIVLEAQRRPARAIAPGKSGRQIDGIARRHIERHGFGRRFGHGTGHGVGLEIHEPPTHNSTSGQVLKRGMVVSCEPGIYIPRWGGVRIEDLLCVTSGGGKTLSRSTKRLLEL